MGCQWPQSEHNILWFEVHVDEAEIIQLLHTSDDLLEDLVKLSEGPLILLLQPVPNLFS